MDYRYLHAFLSACEHLNFTNAAKSLNITPAALGRQVRLFEESLNLQLFIRSPQKVALTKDGKEIYAISKKFQDASNEYLGKSSKKEIRIGTIAPILENWLPDILNSYYKDSPINFKIISDAPSRITEKLEAGELDIGIYNKNIQTDLLTSRKILMEQPILVSKKKVDLKNIQKHRWIIVEEKDYIINYAYKKRIPRSENIIFANSPTAQLKLVEKGLGIAIMSSLMVPHHKVLHTSQIKAFAKQYFYLVMPNSDLRANYIDEFINNIL